MTYDDESISVMVTLMVMAAKMKMMTTMMVVVNDDNFDLNEGICNKVYLFYLFILISFQY
jgi:hypothetical protein